MNINMLMQQAQRMHKDMEGNGKKAKIRQETIMENSV